MVATGGSGNPVVDTINSLVSDSRTRLAMLMGSYLESGWDIQSTGDNGHSFGPFQIYLVAHPDVTAAQAKDPAWATRYMLPSYQAAVARVPDAMWTADPKNAAALAAYYAERPAAMYPASRINSGWAAMQNLGKGILPSGTAGSTGATGTQTAGLLSGIPGLSSITNDIKALVLTTLFAAGGVTLVVLGARETVVRKAAA